MLDRNGEFVWRTKVNSFEWGFSQGVSSNGGFDSAGNVLLPSTNGEVLKMTGDGRVIWTFLGRTDASNDESIAILPDGSVRGYQLGVGTFGIRADGSIIFRGGSGGGTPAVSKNLDICTGATRSSQNHLFPAVIYSNPDGTNRWTYSIHHGGGSVPLFLPSGDVAVGVDNLGTYRFDRDGAVVWTQSYGGASSRYGLGKNGQLYCAAGSSLVAADPASGAILWTAQLPGTQRGFAIDNRGVVYVTTANGYLTAINPDGSIRFSKNVCDEFSTGPALGTLSRVIASGKIGFDYSVFGIE